MQCRWRLNRHTSKRNYIPVELIEKILLSLPVKSLIRFSTVSKSWNSTISRPEFAATYRGREMIVLKLPSSDFGFKAMTCPLSSISSDNPIDEATDFVYPFEYFPGSYLASCNHLWCVEVENSLVLYNPSMQTHRQLPDPLSQEQVPVGSTVPETGDPVFVYGLGYHSVTDDYKIIKIHQSEFVETEIYSLKSDCWRKVESRPPQPQPHIGYLSTRGLFVNDTFHWLLILRRHRKPMYKNVILSFNLSEEKFEEIELAEHDASFFVSKCYLDMIVFGGKLRVYRNHKCCFTVWVMEDYESKLWIKEMEIDYTHIPPLCYSYLKPFYFYDSVGNLVRAVTCSNDMEHIFIYEDGCSTLAEKTFSSKGFGVIDSFTYVESFISPWYVSFRKGDDARSSNDAKSFVSSSGKCLKKRDDVGSYVESFVSSLGKSLKNGDDVGCSSYVESFVSKNGDEAGCTSAAESSVSNKNGDDAAESFGSSEKKKGDDVGCSSYAKSFVSSLEKSLKKGDDNFVSSSGKSLSLKKEDGRSSYAESFVPSSVKSLKNEDDFGRSNYAENFVPSSEKSLKKEDESLKKEDDVGCSSYAESFVAGSREREKLPSP